MKINIITEKAPGWVLRRISEEYCARMPDTYITDMEPDGKADVNLYINYALMKDKTSAYDVAWFTHRESDAFDQVAAMVDLCIAMCFKTSRMLPTEKTFTIEPCADQQFTRRPVVYGCVGRNYKSGRKRFDFIKKLKQIEGTRFLFTNQKYEWRDMPDFYNAINYLLVLSENEGGPLPVLEAIAAGKPVIAPDVGWCWDYPVITYTGYDDLERIIRKLVPPRNLWDVSADTMYRSIRAGYYEFKHR